MCTFITAWVYENSSQEKLKEILSANGFDFQEYPDSPIKSKKGVPIYFRPTKGLCDCGTELDSVNNFADVADKANKKIADLRKKKWSETKINRWLKEHQLSEQKMLKSKEEREKLDSYKVKNKDWLKLFNAILENNEFKVFGLLFHEYYGDQSIEDFALKAKVHFNLKQIGESHLDKLEPDVPYEISISNIKS